MSLQQHNCCRSWSPTATLLCRTCEAPSHRLFVNTIRTLSLRHGLLLLLMCCSCWWRAHQQ